MTATKRVAEKGGMGIWYGVPVIPNVLVDQILAAKRQQPPLSSFDKGELFDADTAALERQIDQMVYKLYDLAPAEIEIVEGEKK